MLIIKFGLPILYVDILSIHQIFFVMSILCIDNLSIPIKYFFVYTTFRKIVYTSYGQNVFFHKTYWKICPHVVWKKVLSILGIKNISVYIAYGQFFYISYRKIVYTSYRQKVFVYMAYRQPVYMWYRKIMWILGMDTIIFVYIAYGIFFYILYKQLVCLHYL